MITIHDIFPGAKFQTESGIVWIIDKVSNGVVSTSMENGEKGNYKDSIEDCVEFLNEVKAVKI